jgi:hypothetical protein
VKDSAKRTKLNGDIIEREEQTMKIKTQWLLVVIVTVFLCWIGWRTQAQNSAKDLWEYKVVPTVTHPSQNRQNLDINELGAQGWELVTSGTVEEPFGNPAKRTDYLYFKRKK